MFILLGLLITVNACKSGCLTDDSDCPIETCCELGFIKSAFVLSNVYKLKHVCGNRRPLVKGYCDTVTDGGGWLVIQRRKDGSVDFNRNWKDYEFGFGSLTGEFWYGLHSIHCLTRSRQWELRIDFRFTNGTYSYLSYKTFSVGPPSEQYPVNISGYSGIAPTDPFTYSHSIVGHKFTTRDRDNDRWELNCARNYQGGKSGGWWYRYCSDIVLNHQYNHGNTISFEGKWYALPFSEMKIRPLNCDV